MKQVLIWVVMLAGLILCWQFVKQTMNGNHDKAITMTELLTDAEQAKISDVTVSGTDVSGKFKDGKESFHTTIPANYPDFYTQLRAQHINVNVKDPVGSFWVSQLIAFAPIAVLLGLFLFMMRQMQSGGNKAMSFGKNRARLLSMQQKKITFKDVAGVDEAKEELKEIIEFLREAQKFQRLGGRIPKGVLMVGPPGNG